MTGPAEPVPVAILARTSTLALQDPFASLNRQITSAREWLPEGFYVAGYYWDVESGGLDIEQRGHGSYDQLTARGLPGTGAWLICWPRRKPHSPGSRPWWSKTSSGPPATLTIP